MWKAAEIKLGGEKLIEHWVDSLLRLRDRVDARPQKFPTTPTQTDG
ncbi:MAG: hypothetical protein OXE79_09560 [Acidimicrobiaceae bacterium]|nr:hypothetical protein [Acidimicrobiaceae bacterium]MCY4280413.1 hypothetical protein [Acidimicrobiaceae bacterium]MCY4293999.1 hypothetical protein [Acidimicrobiaceae bacterium]